MKKACFFLALVLTVGPDSLSYAQSNPGFSYGFVPTAGEWNSYFSAKQDVLGFVPLNRAGGTLTGPVNVAPSTSSKAGLNYGPGAAPSLPNDGDMWLTTVGFYVRVAGQVYNLTSNKLAMKTVATLPPCNSSMVGAWSAVSDATAPIYNGALTGGGNVQIPVFCGASGSTPTYSWTAH